VSDTNGRFLLQDYRTGDWRIMTEREARQFVQNQLSASANSALSGSLKTIDWLTADYRFGIFRGTNLARRSLFHLRQLREHLLAGSVPSVAVNEHVANSTRPYRMYEVSKAVVLPRASLAKSQIKPFPQRLSTHDEIKHEFGIGNLVWCIFKKNEWYPGSIISVRDQEHFEVAFDDGTEEVVHKSQLRKFEPVTEGNRVRGCFADGFEDCYPGTVGRVTPNGQVMIVFDDGDVEWNVSPDRYYLPPYKYAW